MKKFVFLTGIIFLLNACSREVDIEPQNLREVENPELGIMLKNYKVIKEEEIVKNDEIEIVCDQEIRVTGPDGYCWGYSLCQRHFLFWDIGDSFTRQRLVPNCRSNQRI